MNTDTQLKPVTFTSWMRKIIFFTTLQLTTFLIGFVPMWLKSRQYARCLYEAERQLNMERIHHALISAIIEVRQNNYEPARQAASDFFTFLRVETGMGDDAVLSPEQIESVQKLFAQRDEIITLLAQSDPLAADLLADLYGLYREIINQ